MTKYIKWLRTISYDFVMVLPNTIAVITSEIGRPQTYSSVPYPEIIDYIIGNKNNVHDDVIKWKHFPRYWPFVRGIHRSPLNSPQKGQWRGALMFSLIYAWINAWLNNREAGDLRRHRAYYDVTVMLTNIWRVKRIWATEHNNGDKSISCQS